MAKKDPRVDAYIAKAAPFAQPILKTLRAAIHEGVPDVAETIRWSMPSFDVAGKHRLRAHAADLRTTS